MRLRLGRPRTAMVIAPHPDDETIGAAGLIHILRQRGTRVWVVVVSNGAASHPGSRRWPRARLVAERRRETRRALRRLGVDAGAIRFLSLPDGGLPADRDACNRRVRREIARCQGLRLLVGPSAADDHPDHRAVAGSVTGAARSMRHLAYRVWPPRRGTHGRTFRLAAAIGSTGKRSLIRCHRTQCGAVRDDPHGFSISRHELDAFAHPVEHYEVVR